MVNCLAALAGAMGGTNSSGLLTKAPALILLQIKHWQEGITVECFIQNFLNC